MQLEIASLIDMVLATSTPDHRGAMGEYRWQVAGSWSPPQMGWVPIPIWGTVELVIMYNYKSKGGKQKI